MNKKRFISFEGLDYSGKSTQIQLLKTYLEKQGFHVYAMREPGGTVISEKIREILLDQANMNMTERCEIFLYSAARVQLVQERIMPLLEQNYFVLADRYVDSTTAYQGFGRKLNLEMVQAINQAATFGLLPLVTFYLRMQPEQVYQRTKNSGRPLDRLENAGMDFYHRVFQGYEKIVENNSRRFFVLDATESIEHIHRKIVEVVKKTALDEL